ncbi:beta-ketoacyl-ACP synthase III [Sporomusa acidovorans]|uniref:Beta-ketoacyl-[acyl-carrier-protein] synthase III n=1 Tax=Sporomusa acidovorans (strain ATCC 49682 / DSM 3132 / Mol) TaxID=1123286 RepID=A0ABZ3J368_SPOA4|nr:beta-ketoacyl-ACP synthase III [Sporomusa acidovorans]OZC20002.1 3-oxoacyl-[acyl-carrier-protein] synthase 3 protein 1 [Sporomusa acidovorans DSM 3132]SDD47888.1 3-oxoacyl-[acyl-carrier-protein] synthase-3 [Sporomusa acidovorans]
MSENKAVGIIGIGTYVPEKVMTNKDLESMVETSHEWIVERTGIHERRIASPDMATSDLASKAAQRALDDAGVTAEEIDLIIVATATPDMFFPSTACLVQANIKATNAAAFDLAAGCSGFVYGMVTGSQFIKAGLYKKVLVIGAETLSKILDWTDRNTCVLFGDGAGAAVLAETSAGYGILASQLGADGSGGDLLKLPAGGSRNPASAETVSQRMHFVHMNGNEVFKFAVRVMGEAAVKALEDAGLSADDVDCLIPHQANIRIIQSAAKRLKLPMDKVMVNVNKYGNTSAASIPIALEEAVHSGKIKQGDIVVLVGFGAGLTWASSVIKWGKEANTNC